MHIPQANPIRRYIEPTSKVTTHSDSNPIWTPPHQHPRTFARKRERERERSGQNSSNSSSSSSALVKVDVAVCLILRPTRIAVPWPLDLEGQIISITHCNLDVLVCVDEDPGGLVSVGRSPTVVLNSVLLFRDVFPAMTSPRSVNAMRECLVLRFIPLSACIRHRIPMQRSQWCN